MLKIDFEREFSVNINSLVHYYWSVFLIAVSTVLFILFYAKIALLEVAKFFQDWTQLLESTKKVDTKYFRYLAATEEVSTHLTNVVE